MIHQPNTSNEDERTIAPAESFVLPDESDESATIPQTPETGRFNVLPHLLLLSGILIVLFGAIIIPKTLSYLQFASVTPPLPPPIVTEPITPQIDYFADLSLTAEAVHVWDISTQQTLFERNAKTVYPLASITKLMTALVSYELADDDTVVIISNAAANQESGGWFMPGERYKLKQLADFALITSYNSAAYTLADSVGALLGSGDPVTQFVTAMNIRADELGLSTMEFNNSTGLDISSTRSGGYGTAAEVNRLLGYIVSNYPEVLLPTITPRTRLYNTNGDYHEADNTNDRVTDIPNLIGSKTGYTDLAGGNLTIVFDVGFNHYVAITVLGSTRDARFSDVQKLVAAVQSTFNPSPNE